MSCSASFVPGVELLGIDSPMADVEVIEMGYRVLLALGLGDRCVVKLNSLGTREWCVVVAAAVVVVFLHVPSLCLIFFALSGVV